MTPASSPQPASVSRLIEEDPRELYENAPCGYLSTLPDGTIVKANATFLAWTGYESRALLDGKRFQDLLPVAGKVFYDTHLGPLLLMQGFVKELAFEVICADGGRLPVLLNAVLKREADGSPLVIRFSVLNAQGRRAYEEELRRAKRKAEEAEATVRQLASELEQRVEQRTRELRRTEDALRQTQKMEAIGKLTGGVAHDFNNILQIIAGNLELLKLQFAGDPQAGHRLQQARFAVERGAKLASQLLSFARRQPLQPVPTNLGRVLREMGDLLRRALGEAIETETVVSGGLWTTSVDRHQLENVILNLAINARDAMQGVGKLTLELGNALLDEQYARAHAEVKPGQYVMLAISDTGSGMSPEVIERAFEPFFTTKPEGAGTGLGLSMVYGFVKQSEGHIKVYSEMGAGTTFKIYLPRVRQEEVVVPDTRSKPVHGGSETILVVEDDLAVQAIAVDILSSLGYRVLKANDGQSALSILQSGVSIDLLFADVVMPGPVRSPDLAQQAQVILPDIAVLFTSGYTQNAIVHGGRLDPGVELLGKPYRREDLARKVRLVLEGRKKARPVVQSAHPDQEQVSFAGPMEILVVEDNLDTQAVLCELLGVLGHRARGVSSAAEALQALSRTTFDVLITDIGLPDKSGTALAHEAVVDHPQLQVVFSSGHGVIKDEKLNASSLPKPYNLEAVMDLLSKLAARVARARTA